MAKVTNIYVTCKQGDLYNRVIIKVLCEDGHAKYIESTIHGYEEIKNNESDDIFEIAKSSDIIDFIEPNHSQFEVYNISETTKSEHNVQAIFIRISDFAVPFFCPQHIYIRNNNWLGTNAVCGGKELELEEHPFHKTDKIITSKSLIEGTIRELKECFPELKIKLKDSKPEAEPENE